MITILTPTYNRAYILPKAFESLKRQTCFDFEWIIVDDGSKDNTEEMVSNWLKGALPFKIKYIKQNNGGKHRAVNNGVRNASCDYILILDSDDYLEKRCVKLVHEWIGTIKDLSGFAGVAGLKGWINKSGSIGGKIENDSYVDCTNLERSKYGLLGDKAEIYKTDIMKRYPFPEFEGENFIRENSSWDRIAQDGLKIRWFNKIIYYCEYLEDGLTQGTTDKTYIKNFNGFTYCSKLSIENSHFPLNYIRIGNYSLIAKKAGKSVDEICKLLNKNKTTIIMSKIMLTMKALVKRR